MGRDAPAVVETYPCMGDAFGGDTSQVIIQVVHPICRAIGMILDYPCHFAIVDVKGRVQYKLYVLYSVV